ncbi:MAG TPA: rhomboid family intramembrane serine protease [Solirubrobacteraceae bacterium]|nr:rhomboid family intramembrane serine protease [Solirubrobacteraceae bacterium]
MFPLKDNVPRARFPIVTVALIAANVVVYLLEIRHGGSFFGGPTAGVALRYGAIPHDLDHARRLGTALTSMFLHASFLHIFGNMIFLAIFGPTVEDAIGRVRFVVFYLIGGLVALGAQIAADPGSAAPTLGASGAIAAVLGGYILLYPRARVLALVFIVFFFTLVEIPAGFLLGFWLVEQLYFSLAGLASVGGAGSSSEGVAYFAHVGGFAFGLLAIKLLVARRSPRAAPPPSPSVY